MSSENSAPDSAPNEKAINNILVEALGKKEVQDALKEACRGKDPAETLKEVTMVVPMLLALTICPAMLGTQESIRQSQSKNKREEHRARRCNLVVSCVKQSIRSRDIDGKLVVLKDNKLWITTAQPASHDEESETFDGGYPFSGYYLPYPDTKYEGLVSTISDDPPMLNWIYVDKETYEVKYGFRPDAQPHLTGPFDCTRQDRRMTFEGWEGFVAVEDYPGMWALYFDRDDDGLATKVPMGTRVLEVELTRREKKERKPEPDPNQPQTLDEKMKQHKEQSQREDEEANEFLQNGQEAQHQEQTSSSDSKPASLNNNGSSPDSSDTMATLLNIEKLKLDSETAATPQRLTPAVPSPSTHSDNMSFWSSAKKADNSYDNASVTAASSIGADESSDLNTQTRRDGQELLYKQPSVDDDTDHDIESVAM
ncbi:hypothetical protein F5B22DRAFT_607390 [Xylaria bambusicola]|uniref:uncharacterized protein n=1 Tax=Xylaria bambusicola TaxID=326684 RepID=UPI0020074807|nr:uncharacterized protein F5B22DRAFT_607390 [Xylaria bambusicola]KAI0515454.1 hypothetical protein F5B22DRAFT_607390 [Xylaria bambusicola]